jgi:hypothetical protein
MADVAGIIVCGALLGGAFILSGYSLHKQIKNNIDNNNNNKRYSESLKYDTGSGKRKSRSKKVVKQNLKRRGINKIYYILLYNMSEALEIGLGVGIPAALIVGTFYYLSIPVQKKESRENIISDSGIEMVENQTEAGHILVGGKKSRNQGKKRKSKKNKNKNK